MTSKRIDPEEVIEKAEHGDKLTAAEQRAYERAVEQAAEEAGYEPTVWAGVTMYRILDEQDRTFPTEREAAQWVMRSRVHRNLTGY